MKSLKLFLFITLYSTISVLAQEKIEGKIIDAAGNQIPFVNISWDKTSFGTVSDKFGIFSIYKTSKSSTLVISSIGYKTQKIEIGKSLHELIFTLNKSTEDLDEVVVSARMKSEIISKINIRKIEKLTKASLEKLPCCHLAASFENTLSVDKTYTDALTGTEEIKMLGLAGVYSQILSEEVPIARGLSAKLGLSVPGAYLNSISISKGIASVISGYEGITGQIQMFLKQPENSERFFLNLYGNSFGASDVNMYKSFEISDKWNSMLLLHASSHFIDIDKNNDDFKDSPTGLTGNITQTFKYENKGKYRHQFAYKYMYKESKSGQMNFDEKRDKGTKNYYGVGILSKRFEILSNQMFRLNNIYDVTFGIKMNYIHIENDSYFGLNSFTGKEDNFNSSLNIEKKWNSLSQKLNFGGSLIYDNYNNYLNITPLTREEVVTGIHAEYTIMPIEHLTIIAGVRNDFHNLYGNMFTPRFSLKYNLNKSSVLRLIAGKGYRVANPVNDNIGQMASSRTWNLPHSDDLLEEAWNFGGSISHDLIIANKTIAIEVDYYHTEFEQKLIRDLETTGEVNFYQLNGRSYADNYQAAISFNLIKNCEMKVSGRYNNVKENYNGVLKDKLYNAKLKGLLSLSYATKYSKWQFDITNQLIGKARLSYLEGEEYEEYSPAFYMLHAQITRRLKHFDIYLASENMTNYTQKKPIISADKPFSSEFNATRVWAPILGTKISGGIRFKIK